MRKTCLCTTWGIEGENFEYNGCPLHTPKTDQQIRWENDFSYDKITPMKCLQEQIVERNSEIARLTAALSEATATLERYREALRPFANYACDPPCGCHNCIARDALREEK